MATGTSLEVVNHALTFLGERPLVSDVDDVPAADVVRDQWDFVRRAELSAAPWSFAVTRDSIASDVSAPAFGWSYAYTLPAGLLRLVELPDLAVSWVYPYGREPLTVDEAPAYELEGGKLLCDQAGPLKVRYVQDVEDWSLWHPLFKQAMAYRFAVILAEAVTQSTAKRQEAANERAQVLALAKRVNALQKPPRRLLGISPWLQARGG
jgi:hypothetical protein